MSKNIFLLISFYFNLQFIYLILFLYCVIYLASLVLVIHSWHVNLNCFSSYFLIFVHVLS